MPHHHHAHEGHAHAHAHAERELPPAPRAAPTQGPVLSLTPHAAEQVKLFMKQEGQEGTCFSIRVTPSGCSGMGYDLSLGPSREGDLTWEQDGVKIATDPNSAGYLAGTVVDYVSTLEGAGFKFANPQARQSCGCGNSFSA